MAVMLPITLSIVRRRSAKASKGLSTASANRNRVHVNLFPLLKNGF